MDQAQDTQRLLDALIARFDGELEDVADRVLARIRAEVPELAVEAGGELWAAMRRSALADMRGGLAAFTLAPGVPPAPPLELGDLARVAARARVPLATLLRSYRVGQAAFWEALFEAVYEIDAPPEAKQELLRAATMFLLGFVDQVSVLMTDAFTEERDRMLRRSERSRFARILAVVAGGHAAEDVLGHPLASAHLGLVASGPDAAPGLRRLAAEAGARALVVTADDERTWAWLGAEAPALAAIHDAIDARAGGGGGDDATDGGGGIHRLGVGRPARGLEGFRATHRQAGVAHGVAVARGRATTRYEDVALEALAAADETAARHFVDEELRGLAGDGAHQRRLRETLHCFLASGQNGAATAGRLGLGARTVSHRLRRIEELIGAPIASRATELHTALRLERFLGDAH